MPQRTSDKIERLMFVKFLLKQAESQKELERPLCSTAILTLHDSVECFLQLCLEQVKGDVKNYILDNYVEEINKELIQQGKDPIPKAFIKRLNELRNLLKHSTIFTDPKQIPNLFSEVEIFLNDFTQVIFKINFEDISLIELIADISIKDFLVEGESAIARRDYQYAMWQIGKAYYELEERMTKVSGIREMNLTSTGQDIDYTSKYTAQIFGEKPDSVLKENLQEIATDFNVLKSEIENIKIVLCLGIDLKEHSIFKQHMPSVSKIIKGESGVIEFWIPDQERHEKKEYQIDVVKFCRDFVIRLALKSN